jgi:predicted adenine nucleotide alpha hydrolase (AANH) superfamily ATPase
MFNWNPLCDEVLTWEPKSGWNRIFSEQDKIQYTTLFFFFKNKKGCKEEKAEILAQMVLFKQKYNGLMYSEEQESILQQMLKPVIHLAKA